MRILLLCSILYYISSSQGKYLLEKNKVAAIVGLGRETALIKSRALHNSFQKVFVCFLT